MIYNVKDGDQYLYHYTSSATAINHILPSGRLRLSPIRETNDPKETKCWDFSYTSFKGNDLTLSEWDAFSGKFNSALKDKTRVACFSMDHAGLSGGHIQDVALRGFSKPRMWAQYADQHRGLCLVFDKKELIRKFSSLAETKPLLIYDRVKYHDRSHVPQHGADPFCINIDILKEHGFAEMLGHHVRAYHRELFFEKMTDWAAEQEFRLLLFSDTSEDIFLDISSSLRGIVFGGLATDDVIQASLTCLRGKGTEFTGIDWRNGSPWYDFGNRNY